MIKKTNVLALLIALALSLSGCSDYDPRVPIPDISTELTAGMEEETFDIPSLSQKLTLGGNSIRIPCYLEDFGSGLLLSGPGVSLNGDNETFVIQNAITEKPLVTATFYNSKRSKGKSNKARAMIFSISSRAIMHQELTIDGIGFGATESQVRHTFGEPTEILGNVEDEEYFYRYLQRRRQLMEFHFENNIVDHISFTFLPEIYNNYLK